MSGIRQLWSPHTPPLYLVVLEKGESAGTSERERYAESNAGEREGTGDEGEAIAELRQELWAKEEYLQTVNEQLQTANEELKSSNEEMQSMNEELQTKVADLSRANNDMNNLLAGTGIATIFVDHQLRILRFTPAATEVIHLIGSDVGRPVGHIVSDLENYNRLVEDIQEVLDTLIPKELEVHHRIKNNLASVEGLLSMQIKSVSNKEVLMALQDAAGRVKSMEVLYDRLLVQEGYKESSVKAYIEGLIVSLKNLYFEETSLEIERRIVDFELPPNRLFPLGIIINELLTNVMKHAFKETGASGKLILVALTKTKDHVRLTLEDNGRGLPEGFTADGAGGFGLTLVGMLTEQLGGSYTIENREATGGSRSIVEFDV